MSEVGQARELLKSKGYYTNYKCDDVEAQNVLYSVFENEWLVEQIFVMIDEQCEAKGIKKNER